MGETRLASVLRHAARRRAAQERVAQIAVRAGTVMRGATETTDFGAGMRRRLTLTARRFAADNAGASAIEYGVLIAAIALVIVGLVSGIGDSVSGLFDKAKGIYGN